MVTFPGADSGCSEVSLHIHPPGFWLLRTHCIQPDLLGFNNSVPLIRDTDAQLSRSDKTPSAPPAQEALSESLQLKWTLSPGPLTSCL